jgi:hypothetical protein
VTTFAYIRGSRVVTVFTTARPASDFPDIQANLVVVDASVQQGDYYNGSIFQAAPFTLVELKILKQQALDSLFDARFDLTAFIREGTATNVTANNVGSFLAAITNNYRTLRAQIAAAASISVLNAIDITAGWPNNP